VVVFEPLPQPREPARGPAQRGIRIYDTESVKVANPGVGDRFDTCPVRPARAAAGRARPRSGGV